MLLNFHNKSPQNWQRTWERTRDIHHQTFIQSNRL